MSDYKIYIYPSDIETGELGNSKPKKVTPPKLTFNQKPTFRTNVIKQGQSGNVEDVRVAHPEYVGNHLVQVCGYLTRNTWFHLASQIKYDIGNALQSRGFGIIYSSASDRDKKNSQYNFEVHLRVLDRYSTQQVRDSLVYALGQTIALPNSIRIINIYDYKK
jgi:hypothetical protein